MKKLPILIASGSLLGACLLLAQNPAPAPQEQKPWEQRAAERFGDTPHADQKAQIDANLPTASPAKKDHRILVFYRCEGFIHTSIPYCNYALQSIAKKTGAFSVDLADQYSALTKENLAKYDALLLNSTTHLAMGDEQKAAMVEFINNGGGIVGIHAATDTFGDWPEGIALMGGVFNGHPWTSGGTWSFKVEDPAHRLNAAFQGKGFWHKDEIYWYQPDSFQGRDKLRILLSLDLSKPETQAPLLNGKQDDKLAGRKPSDVDVPVSWCREIGKGRLFVTNLGHNDMTFANRTMLQHMLDGIQYTLRDIDADATPSSQVKVDVVDAPATP